ncbi:MAG: PilZ domain-containing protein [Nitrospirota bacterium]|nr:PilZ domain-containing protein [Nitrospirota bacterium]
MKKSPDKPSERRLFYRLDSSVAVLRTFLDHENDLRRDGVIARNVSAGGILFINNESLPVGCVSELELYLPDGQKPIVALGRVVRVEELESENGGHVYETGVQFLHLQESETTRLHRFCNHAE